MVQRSKPARIKPHDSARQHFRLETYAYVAFKNKLLKKNNGANEDAKRLYRGSKARGQRSRRDFPSQSQSGSCQRGQCEVSAQDEDVAVGQSIADRRQAIAYARSSQLNPAAQTRPTHTNQLGINKEHEGMER